MCKYKINQERLICNPSDICKAVFWCLSRSIRHLIVIVFPNLFFDFFFFGAKFVKTSIISDVS